MTQLIQFCCAIGLSFANLINAAIGTYHLGFDLSELSKFSANTQLSHPAAQGIRMEFKDQGRSFWPFNNPVSVFEGFENMPTPNVF